MKEYNFKSFINDKIKPAGAEEEESNAQNTQMSDFILARQFQTFENKSEFWEKSEFANFWNTVSWVVWTNDTGVVGGG